MFKKQSMGFYLMGKTTKMVEIRSMCMCVGPSNIFFICDLNIDVKLSLALYHLILVQVNAKQICVVQNIWVDTKEHL